MKAFIKFLVGAILIALLVQFTSCTKNHTEDIPKVHRMYVTEQWITEQGYREVQYYRGYKDVLDGFMFEQVRNLRPQSNIDGQFVGWAEVLVKEGNRTVYHKINLKY